MNFLLLIFEFRYERLPRDRWHQALKDNGHENIHHQQFRHFTTMWHIYFLQNKQQAKNKRAPLLNNIHQRTEDKKHYLYNSKNKSHEIQ